jgi:hypothetical protein
MTIYVYRAATGEFRPVTRVYVAMKTNVASVIPREVLLVQVAEKVPGQAAPNLVTYHDRYQQPATGLRGTAATHSSAQIAWTAPPRATDYQVLIRTKAPGAASFGAPEIRPAPDQWIQQISYDALGLQPNYEYSFQVRSKRTAANGDAIVNVKDSDMITLATGHPAALKTNPNYGGAASSGTNLVRINAAGTKTWTPDYHWGTKSRTPHIVQGYLNDGSMNARGGVYYGTTRSQLATWVHAIHPELTKIELDTLLNQVQVIDSRIDYVYRYNLGGSTNPQIRVYASKLNYNSGATPPGGTPGGTYSTFTAPTAGRTADEIAVGQLTAWAREWIKPAPIHNGMLIYNGTASGNNTIGHNGYCVLRGCDASYAPAAVDDWRLNLWVKWSYTFPDLPPSWS